MSCNFGTLSVKKKTNDKRKQQKIYVHEITLNRVSKGIDRHGAR